ncbi:MAG: hypothetical protein ACKPE6_14645, partial [Gammaproteobacteria bacterium]
TAIVLANGLNGYGALRSLAKAGIRAIAVAPSKDDLSARSRLPERCIIVPMDDAWERRVLAVLQGIDVPAGTPLLACSDRAAVFLQNNQQVLSRRFGLLIPGGTVIETLNDKRTELELMLAHGIPVPASVTHVADTVESAPPLRLPVIIKPRTYEGYSLIKAKNVIVRTAASWSEFHREYAQHLDAFVAQEIIEGPDENLWVCNATVDREHRIARFFSFRRLGTAPSHFGVTSFAESCHNEALSQRVQQIACALSYVGPLMVEFKFDPITQQYLYLETNPRLGMCNWFDTACGVNNVEAVCSLSAGLSLQAGTAQREGILYLHALADLTARLENRESLLSIARRYARALRSPVVWAIFTLRDPIPFLYSAAAGSAGLVPRILRQVRLLRRQRSR